MSVLIKGIDLPEVYGSAILAVYECIDGRAIRREYNLTATQIQAISPHGRLVDADALKATFCAECNHTITCKDCDIDYHIGRLAPTITEAEGEKE